MQSVHTISCYVRSMSAPKRETGKSIQVAVRLPKDLYAAMKKRPAPIARQIIKALERELAPCSSQGQAR